MPRIIAYGYFGMGNLGNEGSLAAFAAAVRKASDHTLTCLGADGAKVTSEHRIPARSLMTLGADRNHRHRPLTKMLSRVLDIPRTWWLTRNADLVIVPGTGVLESSLAGGPWGLTFWMLIAALCCRIRGGQMTLLAVGAEPAPTRTTGLMMRWITQLSEVSFRDEASRLAAESFGSRAGCQVLPDLAFALAGPEPNPRPGHVVVGVMRFGDLDALTIRLTEALQRLVLDGRTVTLVVGDLADRPYARLLAAGVDAPPGTVTVNSAENLEDLMAVMATAEVVVASRFHNIVCSLKACRPTISLSYAPKNQRLLAEFGLGEYDQPLESFDVDLLLKQINSARDNFDHHRVGAQLAAYHAEVSDAIDRVLTRATARGGRSS